MFPADAPLAAPVDRTATPSLDDHDLARLFPTEGRTAFGTWVKAGALKPGDRVSTRGSVEGARGAANDNEAVTLRSIERDDADQRVYNFAVQSLPGEVTHNYLVGEGEWWTHNAGNPRKFWDSLTPWKNGWRRDSDGNIYYPDRAHPGELECFNPRGKFLGARSMKRGKPIPNKQPGDPGHKGRTINP